MLIGGRRPAPFRNASPDENDVRNRIEFPGSYLEAILSALPIQGRVECSDQHDANHFCAEPPGGVAGCQDVRSALITSNGSHSVISPRWGAHDPGQSPPRSRTVPGDPGQPRATSLPHLASSIVEYRSEHLLSAYATLYIRQAAFWWAEVKNRGHVTI